MKLIPAHKHVARLERPNILELANDADPRTVSLEDAKRLVSEGLERKRKMMEPLATLGEDPETKGTIQVKDGRYGPYVTDGTTNATIKKGTDPKNVTLPEAIELLKKKRAAPKRNWTRKKKAMDA